MHYAHGTPETVKDVDIFIEAYFPDGFRTEHAVRTVCLMCFFFGPLCVPPFA